MRIGFVTNSGYENRKLCEAAREIGEAVLVNPGELFYKLAGNNTKIYQSGDELNLDLMVIRLVSGNARSILGKVTARMNLNREPAARFKTGGIPKINSELNRELSEPNHPVSYVCFSPTSYQANKQHIQFPVIYKPQKGRHGEGIVLFNTVDELDVWQWGKTISEDKPLFLQEFIQNIIREYRVYLVNNQVVNWVKKYRAPETRKLFKGRRFDAVDLPDDVRIYCEQHARPGMVGLDIVKTREGDLFIIEQNRAPEWERTDTATNKNTARKVLEAMING